MNGRPNAASYPSSLNSTQVYIMALKAINRTHNTWARILGRVLMMGALTSAALQAGAAVQLDQDAKIIAAPGTALAVSQSVQSGPSGFDLLQTFTAGKTGQLAAIGLQAYQSSGLSPQNFILSVYQGNGTEVGNAHVGQLSFISSQSQESFLAGNTFMVDTTSFNLSVNAGSVYSYSISADRGAAAPAFISLRFALGTQTPDGSLTLNDYQGGRNYRQFWADGVAQGWILDSNYQTDRGFQTFVDVSVVPEAASLAMLLAGLMLMAVVAHLRARG
jgi:hypothetical protein